MTRAAKPRHMLARSCKRHWYVRWSLPVVGSGSGSEVASYVTMDAMERFAVEQWIAGYERAWRSPGTHGLLMLFTPDVSYHPSPWVDPVVGLEALSVFWEAERSGPDEEFTFHSNVIAIEGRSAVVRVDVDYVAPGQAWRDLWVLRFGVGGRCARFEEWPFAQ
jgi:SnoaL-like domain